MPPSTPLVLQHLAGNDAVTTVPLQTLLAPHIDTLTTLWITVWVMTAAYILCEVVRAYVRHEKARGA